MKWIVSALVGAVVLLFGVAVWNVANAVPEERSAGVAVRESEAERAERLQRLEDSRRGNEQRSQAGSQAVANIKEAERKAAEEEQAKRRAAEESQPKPVPRKPVQPQYDEWDDDEWDDDEWDDDEWDDDEWDDD